MLVHNGSYTYAYFFWILSTIKMKFGQILPCCITFVTCFWLIARDWKLIPGPSMTNSKIWPILLVDLYQLWVPLIHLFQKNETLESWHSWLLSDWSRLLNWKGAGTYPQSSKLFKIIVLVYIYQLAKLGDSVSYGSKDIFKNAPCFMY